MKKVTFYLEDLKKDNLQEVLEKAISFSNRNKEEIDKERIIIQNLDEEKAEEIFDFIKEYFEVSGVAIYNIFTESKIDKKEIKVKIKNKYLAEKLNDLIRTLTWAMYEKNITQEELGRVIVSASTLITMKYHGFDTKEFSVGDVVECCYGSNLKGEISGGHTHAIVCDINSENMPYLIPIGKEKDKSKISSSDYIVFKAEKDVIYTDEKFKGGTLIIDKGKYLAPGRIIKVIGKTRPEFLIRILKKLTKVYTFYDSKDDETSKKEKNSVEKFGLFGEELTKDISYALTKINKNKSIEENAIMFLREIGINIDEKIMIQSFISASYLPKIDYENIISEVNRAYPEIEREFIKENLKEMLKEWSKNYPQLKKKCLNLTFISLLKIFSKYLNE